MTLGEPDRRIVNYRVCRSITFARRDITYKIFRFFQNFRKNIFQKILCKFSKMLIRSSGLFHDKWDMHTHRTAGGFTIRACCVLISLLARSGARL